MSYLANFAKTGNPNHEDLPVWPAWDNTEGLNKVLVLDAGINDLSISYLKEKITIQDVIDLIDSELEEPERRYVMDMLEDNFILQRID